MSLETQGDSLPRPTKDFSKENQPHILAMIDKRETKSENEKRLTELASKILEDALKQPDKSTSEKTFMKLQNIVDEIVSIFFHFLTRHLATSAMSRDKNHELELFL